MIRMVQLGIDHPHAAAYRGTLWSLRDRIEVVGFLARPDDMTTTITGPYADVPVYRSLDELLNATRPDAAQVMLRNHESGAALTRLANAGIHLWVEKPLARRAADLAPVREIVNRTGLIFTAGYQNRLNPASVHVHDLVRSGALGSLTFAHLMVATTTARLRDPSGPQGYYFDPAISGGGIFHWLGCHMVDLLLHVTGELPAAVTAMTATAGEANVAVEDVAAATLRFPSGWVASLNYGYLQPTKEPSPFGDDGLDFGLYGQQGWVRWNWSTEARSYSADPRRAATPWMRAQFATPPTTGYGHSGYLVMQNFLDAIAGIAEPAYRIEEAMRVLEVIEGAYQAAETGQAVSLSLTA
jgi:predicted dehydrogenase